VKPSKHFIYTRCSTEEQLKKGFSHEYQVNELKQLVSGTCLGTFSDTISGKTFDRPELDTLYALCKRNEHLVTHIWVQKWDRFGRDLTDGLILIRKFKEIGIEVNCPSEHIDFDSDDWSLFLSIKLSTAQIESQKISTRTRNGIKASHLAGYYTASAPFGYSRRESKDKTGGGKFRRILVPDDDAPLIKSVVARFLEGEDRNNIWASIDAPISRSTFYDLFTRPVYAGFIKSKYSKNLILGKHEPIISASDYQEIQNRLIKYQKGNSATLHTHNSIPFPLKGILQDKYGKTMRTEWTQGKRKKYPYYRSSVDKKYLSATKANKIVTDFLKLLRPEISKDILISKLKERLKPEMEQLENKKKEANKIRSRCERIDYDYLEGQLSALDHKRLRASLLGKLSILETDLIKMEGYVNIPELNEKYISKLYDIHDIYQTKDHIGKNILLKSIFPEGFSIQDGKIRTPCINQLLIISDSLSMEYPHLKENSRPTGPTVLVGGGSQNNNRTLLLALSA